MTRRRRSVVGPTLVLALAAGCILPSDESGDLVVQLSAPVTQIGVGDTVTVEVRVAHRNGARAPNALVDLSSRDPAIAFVDPDGVLHGVAEGETEIVGSARNLAGAELGVLPVRVSRGVEVLVIIPALSGVSTQNPNVRFGESLIIVGRGLDPDSLADLRLGEAAVRIVGFVGRDRRDPESVDTLTIVMPFTSSATPMLTFVGRRGGVVSVPVAVTPEDVYELAGDTVPTDFGTLTAPLLLDALAIEPYGRGGNGPTADWAIDWYRVHLPPGNPAVTVTLTARRTNTELWDLPLTFTVMPATAAGPTWTTAPVSAVIPVWENLATGFFGIFKRGFHICRGYYVQTQFYGSGFGPAMASASAIFEQAYAGDSVEIPDAVDITVVRVKAVADPIPYELTVTPGRVSTVPGDPAEENDLCDMAAAPDLSGQPVTHSLDHPHDVDWYDLSVTTPVAVGQVVRNLAEDEGATGNDTLATAQVVPDAVGTAVQGSVGPGDIDFYQIDVQPGTPFVVRLNDLFNANIARLYPVGDATPDVIIRLSFPSDTVIPVVAEGTGSYIVSVQSSTRFFDGPSLDSLYWDPGFADYQLEIVPLISGDVWNLLMSSEETAPASALFRFAPGERAGPCGCVGRAVNRNPTGGFDLANKRVPGPWSHRVRWVLSPADYKLMIATEFRLPPELEVASGPGLYTLAASRWLVLNGVVVP